MHDTIGLENRIQKWDSRMKLDDKTLFLEVGNAISASIGFFSTSLAFGFLVWTAASVGAYATSMYTNEEYTVQSTWPVIGNTIMAMVDLDTEREADVTLFSVAVFFDDSMFSYADASFATYALYPPARARSIWFPRAPTGKFVSEPPTKSISTGCGVVYPMATGIPVRSE